MEQKYLSRNYSRPASLLAMCGMLLALGACGENDTPGANLPEGSIGAQVSTLLADTESALEGASEHPSVDSVSAQMRLTFAGEKAVEAMQDATAAVDGDSELDLEALEDLLDDVILTEDNLQSQGGAPLYRIPVDLLCGEIEADDEKAECEAMFSKARLRIRVEEVSGGVDLTLVVGAADATPVTLEVRDDRLGLVVDIAEVQEVLTALGEPLPGTFAGVLAWSLQVHGPGDASLRLDVREAIDVEAEDGAESVRLHVDRATPLAQVRASAATQSVDVSLDAGAISLDHSGTEGDVSVHARAVKGHLTVREGVEALEFQDLSLGGAPLTVTVDGQTALSCELNRDFGGVANVRLTPSSGGGVTVTMDPALQLSLLVDEAVLEDEPGSDVAQLEVLASNGAQPAVVELLDNSVLVHAGSLEVHAERGFETHTWSIAEGQCVLDAEEDIEGSIQGGVCL